METPSRAGFQNAWPGTTVDHEAAGPHKGPIVGLQKAKTKPCWPLCRALPEAPGLLPFRSAPGL